MFQLKLQGKLRGLGWGGEDAISIVAYRRPFARAARYGGRPFLPQQGRFLMPAYSSSSPDVCTPSSSTDSRALQTSAPGRGPYWRC
jgi:hypothetical protein